MLNLITTLRGKAHDYAMYRRTRDEIAKLSPSVAHDLGFSPEDANRIARRAVWG